MHWLAAPESFTRWPWSSPERATVVIASVAIASELRDVWCAGDGPIKRLADAWGVCEAPRPC